MSDRAFPPSTEPGLTPPDLRPEELAHGGEVRDEADGAGGPDATLDLARRARSRARGSAPRPAPVAAAEAGRPERAAARGRGPARPSSRSNPAVGPGGRRGQLHARLRRGAGDRRRIRLRQDDDRPVARPDPAGQRDGSSTAASSCSGSTSSPKSEDPLRRYRWREISIIFQGAMNALNPVRRVGDQIAEPIEVRLGQSPKAARGSGRGELLELVGIPRKRGRGLPARAVGRDAPAGDDRDGARLRPGHRHRRRADDRPRRDGPGPDPRAARASCGASSGCRSILITHDLSVIAETCDRVMIMYAGRVAEEGPVERCLPPAAPPVYPEAAGRLPELKDIPVWHPDVRVWEVKGPDGQHKALFYGDYFARPSKRSGAWMTSLRDQQKLDGDIAPLVINVCNFAKGADGEPSLLSPDDARTLFHEFGHGLHGMLSNVTYPSLSGTSRVHRFRRAALAALRALAGAAAGAAAVRQALPDRRAAAGRSAASASSPRGNSTRALPPWSSSPRR